MTTYAPPGALPLVYVAGPYTTPDPVENTHNTCQAATLLWESGVIVPVVPHLSLLWHAITPLPYEAWLAIDLHLLAKCDALLRLPGASSGADKEVAYAEAHGIPVFGGADVARSLSLGDVIAWAVRWTALKQMAKHAQNVEVDL